MHANFTPWHLWVISETLFAGRSMQANSNSNIRTYSDCSARFQIRVKSMCVLLLHFFVFLLSPCLCVCAGDRAMIIIGENGRIDWLGLSKNEHVEIAQHRSVANKNHSHSSTWKSESEECVARHRCPNTKQTKIKCSQTAITTTNNNNNKQRRQKKNNGSAHTINEEKKKRERETQKTPTTSRAICNVCRFHLVCGQCSQYFCCHKW